MKIRTDFVTNSSSSSYCVSYSLATNFKKKAVNLDFWPEGEDGSGYVYVGMKNGVDAFVDAVKKCKSVEELISLIINEMEFDDMIEDCEVEATTNEELFKKLDEIAGDSEEDDDEYGGLEDEMLEKVKAFKKGLAKAKELSDIKSVSIVQYYTGWGEFARDGVDDFMNEAITEELDWDDEDAVIEALSDRFAEGDIQQMIDQVQNDSICQFNASITTTIDLASGEVTKEYKFDGDN